MVIHTCFRTNTAHWQQGWSSTSCIEFHGWHWLGNVRRL